MAKTDAGEEVGIGKKDFFPRRLDGLQVGLFDVAAMAQVVANQKGGVHAAAGLGNHRSMGERTQAMPEVGPGHELP